MLTKIMVMLCCCICAASVVASDQLQIAIANWQIEQTQLKNVHADFVLTAQGVGLKATAESIALPESMGQLESVNLSCQELNFTSIHIQCRKGVLSFVHDEFGQQKIQFAVDADSENDIYRITTSGLALASSVVKLDLYITQQHWRMKLKAPPTLIKNIRGFIAPYLSQEQKSVLASWQLAGDIAFTTDVTGHGEQVDTVEVDLLLNQFTASDQAGQYATEAIQARVSIDLQQHKSRWQWQATLDSEHGQAYVAPIFMDLSDTICPVFLSPNRSIKSLIWSNILLKRRCVN